MNSFNPTDLRLFLPELLLGASILLLFVGDLIVGAPKDKRRYLTFLALLGLAASGAAVLAVDGEPAQALFAGQIAFDPLGNLFKLVFIAVTVVAVLTSRMSEELPDKSMGEYYALLLSITFGMNLMATGNDLLMIYLGVEMVSIVSYALAGYRLHSKASSEAALKYVMYGGAASGLMLFGISLFYGAFGTTELTSLHQALVRWDAAQLAGAGFPITILTSIVFMLAGIGYKISVVPFHMWSPDVYEGAPTPFTGFLSVGPKAAGFALLMRVFVGLFVPAGEVSGFVAQAKGIFALPVDLHLPAIVGVIAALTMTVGNLAAIPQNNVKRLLAYSSIAHAGYLLMGFVVLSEAALHAVVLYLCIYYIMNIGAFAVCQLVHDRVGGDYLTDFRGLGEREPFLAACMAVFLLSLTGLPPFAGFIGKFYLFAAVIERGGPWYVALAIVGVVNSAISLYYYAKVIKAMYLSTAADTAPLGRTRGYTALAGALALPTLLLGLYWSPLQSRIKDSVALYRSITPAQVAVEGPGGRPH